MFLSVWSVFVTALLLLIAAGAGRRLIALFGLLPADTAESDRLLFSTGLGLGVLSVLLFLIGLAGLFRPRFIFLLLGMIALASWRESAWCAVRASRMACGPWRTAWSTAKDPGKRGWGLWLTACLVLAAANLLVLLIGSLAPPGQTDFDGLAYHLTVPALYLRWGAIRYDPYLYHSNWPQLIEMLYAVALAAKAAAPPVHLAFGVLVSGVGWALARRCGRAAACTAMLIAWFIPVAGWEASVAYDDLAFALYEALAILAWYRFVESAPAPAGKGENPADRWVLTAGICQGLALGVKYSALAFIPILLLLFAAAVLLRRRRGDIAMEPVRVFLRLLGASLLVSCPWYLRTLVWTHNPVFPFYYSVFGGLNWSRASEEFYRHLQLGYGTGHSPVDFVLSPWHLLSLPDRYFEPGSGTGFGTLFGSIGPAFLLLPGLALLTGITAPRRPCERYALLLAAAFAIFYLEWYLLMQQVRYLLPALPLLAPLFGAAVGHCWSSLPEHTHADCSDGSGASKRGAGRQSLQRAAGGAALLILVAAFLWTSAWEGISILRGPDNTSALSYDLGVLGEDEYLAGNIPDLWRVCRWLNAMVPPTERVGLIGEKRGFYIRAETLWLDGFEQTRINYAAISNGNLLAAALQQEHIDYVVVRLGSGLGVAALYGHVPADRPADWSDLNYTAAPSGWPPDRHWLKLYRDAVERGDLLQVYPDARTASSDRGGYVVYRVLQPRLFSRAAARPRI